MIYKSEAAFFKSIVFIMKPVNTKIMKRKILSSAFASTILILFFGFIFATCKKDKLDINNPPNPPDGGSFLSTQDFLNQHAVTSEYFNFDNANGGTFTSVKGSQIIVFPNTFAANGSIVTGNVTMEFKDIYHKSDMILSQMPTTTIYDGILKSSGMFYIRVKQGTQALNLAPGVAIHVKLPLDSNIIDTAMAPFVLLPDSAGNGWGQTAADSLNYIAGYYIYSLYNFSYPADSGTWCNSDNSTYFNNYTSTTFSAHATDDPSLYGTQVFMVFPGINAMVHIYGDYFIPDNFTYYYAPIGLNCTMLAIGVKDSNLYYSKQDFMIASNSIVNFSMTQTNETDLISLINTLNN